MFVRKERAGAAGIYVWPHDGAVIEIPDKAAPNLFAIPDGGFSEVRVDQAATLHPDVAADPDVVRNAGLIRLAVVAEMHTVRTELRAYVDALFAGLRDELLTLAAKGTAAPSAASTPGGPAQSTGVGPGDAGPPGDPSPARTTAARLATSARKAAVR